jgi:hypothetical protein
MAKSNPGIESNALDSHMINRSIQRGKVAEETPTKIPRRMDIPAENREALKLILPP